MLKKFLDGLVFGTGFGIAFILVWVIGAVYLLPNITETTVNEPTFNDPQSAEIAEPDPSLSQENFSFFKDSKNLMKIPENGGILSMSPTSTPPNSERQNTYQLWLTNSELWQIRTIGKKTEIEKLPYPNDASTKTLDSLMDKSTNFNSARSTMTISENEIQKLKSSGVSFRDATLNGKLKITTEGVVFILPNPF